MIKRILIVILILCFSIEIYIIIKIVKTKKPTVQIVQTIKETIPTPPQTKLLINNYHIYQSFNNCGPAALSIALSYYGIHESQEKLGQDLRPYQNPQGDNDDKSVTLSEIAEKAKTYDLITYRRPYGNIEIIKQFISHDIPVITRTNLHDNDDIGHFRIIKGYDELNKQLTQDDSLQGKNLIYSYEEFNNLWGTFNYEYLVLVPKDKQKIAETILGDNLNEKTAWQKAVKLSENILNNNPDDFIAGFNLSVAYYNLGEYKQSIQAFEKVENRLPFRTMWYQIEPILSYYELKDYDRVFALTDQILDNQNRAFSELYIIRGNIYKQQNNLAAAKTEFEKAIFYNKNLEAAKTALQTL